MFRRLLTTETALLLAVVCLLAHLAWPSARAWINRPRPGRQVAVEDEGLRYLFYLPQDYGSSAEWPLLVFLHGSGQRGYDLDVLKGRGPSKLIEEGQDLPFIVAVPQCPPNGGWQPVMVKQLVDRLSDRYRIDRCYLTGYSMGGYGVWSCAAEMPGAFSAVAPVCGGGDPAWATVLTDLPIWAFHGELDKIVPLGKQRGLVEAINEAGGNAKLTIYPKQGHGILHETYSNPALYEWFLRHR